MSDHATVEDLTRRLDEAKATIAALRSADEQYRSIFQAMDEGYLLADVLFDDAGRVIDIAYVAANPAATRMVGMDLTGRRLSEVSPDYEEYWYEIWGRVATTGRGERLERYATPENTWYDFYVFKLHPDDADSRRVAVLFRDATRRKLAEIGLRESEARMRTVLEQAPLAVVFTGPSGEIQFRNAMFDELWGRPAHLTTAETNSDVYEGYHLDGRPIEFEEWPGARAVLRGEAVSDEVLEIVRMDGRRTPCWFAAGPIRDEEGRVAGGVVLFRDVSEERRFQLALHESEERQAFLLKLADALRPSSDPVVVQDAAARILGEHLDADRAYYVALDETRQIATVEREYRRGTAPSLVGEHAYAAFGATLDLLRKGGAVVFGDVETAPNIVPDDLPVYRALGLRAFLNWPLIKDGVLVCAMCVVSQEPRRWTAADRALVAETAERTWAAVERARAEAALRESEERRAFLLQLSDELRPLSDPAMIQQAAMKLLAEKHDVMRAGYMDVHDDGDTLTMAAKFERELVPLPPQIRLSDYGPDIADTFRAGCTRCVRDAVAEAETEEQRAAHLAIGVLSWIIAPLVKGGRLIGIVGVVSGTPRDWTPTEIQLVTDLAERTWDAVQRARSEAALRESEERFAQFAASSADALWIRDAGTLDMEYVSPAIATIYGVPPDAILGDPKHWAALIVPEDRQTALDHIEQARRGEAVVHEFRVRRPSDGSFRWIRNTDFPLLDERGRVQRIGGIAQDVTEAKLAVEHQSVLLAELQHRVRNIMALIRSITARTGERAESAPEYAALMEGRLTTFARVQALLTRGANVGVAVSDIVRDELAAQAAHEDQYALDGPDVVLSPKAAEVLTLAVHELTTNALKYGGLSVFEGRVSVRWTTFERRGTPWLGLDWTEEGTPERPPRDPSALRRGFGSELIEGRIPYELGGTGRIDIGPGGARCRLEFPLREGASILETDAPRRGTVFGGAIDMAGEADLSGHRILVVEDDYFLATDTARALLGCGAEVLGPCPTEEAARDEIREGRPTGAVLDLNLGKGASFVLAEELRTRNVAFVMVTGYDEEAIPAEYDGVPRFQKPTQLKQVVGALAAVLGAAA